MDSHALLHGARRAATWYVVLDLMLGPLVVGAAFLGFALWVLGVAAELHFGYPWFPTMILVGLAWGAIALGAWRLSARVVRLLP